MAVSSDVSGLPSIASTESYHCPEPILMIVGGDPNKDWHVAVFVYVDGVGLRELPEVMCEGSASDNS